MATSYEPAVAKAAQSIRSRLEQLGYRYVQPPWEEAFAAKGPFLLAIKYDARDCASVTFGRQPTDVDHRFFPNGVKWHLQRPFEAWLKEDGKSPDAFAKALGGWAAGGIRTPDFERLGRIIVEHLEDIEKCART